MLKLRVQGLPDEVAAFCDDMLAAGHALECSEQYRNRGASKYVRAYIDVDYTAVALAERLNQGDERADYLEDESQEEEDGATLVEDIAEAVAALWRVVAHLEELAEEPAHRAAANAEACRISEWCQELRTIKEEAQR